MVFGHVLLRGDLRLQTCWRDNISSGLGEPKHPLPPLKQLEEVAEERERCWDACPDDLEADKHQKMNGWLFPEQCFYFFTISIHKALFDLLKGTM